MLWHACNLIHHRRRQWRGANFLPSSFFSSYIIYFSFFFAHNFSIKLEGSLKVSFAANSFSIGWISSREKCSRSRISIDRHVPLDGKYGKNIWDSIVRTLDREKGKRYFPNWKLVYRSVFPIEFAFEFSCIILAYFVFSRFYW